MLNLNNTPSYLVSKFINKLLTDKCENYGYDYKNFKRISAQRCAARKALRNLVSWHGYEAVISQLSNEERVQIEACKFTDKETKVVTEGQTITYIVGQSSNEEITNLMRRLVKGPKAKWVK